MSRDGLAPGSLMIQGAGSNVGKSMLVAGLCRAWARAGLRIAPFKPQNMSNNAAACPAGGEIGRAQALQARAAGLAPNVDMNPVLLKPESERGAQVVVRGERRETVRARDYAALRPTLLPIVLESFERLRAQSEVVVVEGAGSPAEINLRDGDIANMGFARAARTPVVLVGDIDRGGVIAQLVGTRAVLDPDDAAMIRGFLVNKFRGDPELFADGYRAIAERTGWRGYGVAPWFARAAELPAEDGLDLTRPASPAGRDENGGTRLVVACPVLSRIANFDDLDPLRLEPEIRLEMVPPGRALPGDADLVILPGSKSTRGDLAMLRAEGWDVDLLAHVRRGGRVLGLCGGYQMLGRTIADPQGLEGPPGVDAGLGLLDIETEMAPEKRVGLVEATHLASGEPVSAYEIHLGRTLGPDCARPLFRRADGREEGAQSADGRVAGAYLHGVFTADGFRRAYLAGYGATARLGFEATVDAALDALADHLEAHLDVAGLLALARGEMVRRGA